MLLMDDKAEKDGKRPDTLSMQEKLKGAIFPSSTEEFLDENIKTFFDELFESRKLKKSDIIRKANISRTYGYQIIEGRRIGKRDYYILIALAMQLDLRTVQRMLAITGCGALHPLIKRDAAIIFAFNHGYDNEGAYDFMQALGLETLDDGAE